MFGFGGSKGQGGASTSKNVQRRLLVVEVLEARGLLAQAKNGTSDPLVQISLLDIAGRENKNETFRTKPQPGTVTPRFSEKFEIGHFYNMDVMDNLPSLSVNVLHKPPYSVSETPLGCVSVNLELLDQKGETATDQWYPLCTVGRMKNVSGELRLKLKYNSPCSLLDIEEGMNEEDLSPEDAELRKEMEDRVPNELNVTVVQARRLPAKNSNFLSGGGPSSDPLCVLKIEGLKTFETTFKPKTLTPQWNEKFSWAPMSDPQASLRVTVEDKETLKNQFLGRVAVPLAQFSDKKPSREWYKLLNKQYEDDGKDRGEVELIIHWRYNIAVEQEAQELEKRRNASVFSQIKNAASNITDLVGITEGSDDEVDQDELDAEEKDAEQKREKSPEELEEEKKKNAEKMKELEDIEIKSGDYQVQVHIIEARELKAENLNGTSDPIVFVECFKQKRNTIVISNVTSAVYDELFIFNMKDVDKDTFEQSMIRISCYDAGMLSSKGTMIGAFACDATTVYTMNKDHEMYRTWVPLMDDEDPGDVGVQGYLKISIQIIGPGEKVKVHDEEAERAAEIAKETAAGSDIGSLIMSPPTMIKEWKFLVVRIFKAEGLPIMDGKVGIGFAAVKKAGTDGFIKLAFAGGKPLKSKVVTTTGDSRSMMTPIFMSELWYPVSMPTMTQVIKVSVWDHDPEKCELIGNVIERLNNVKKANGQAMDVQWYNMYGAHEFKTEKLLANVKKGAELIAQKAKQSLGADIDWRDFYNNTPEKGSSFKGRVLMQVALVDKRPTKYEKKDIAPFRRKLGAWKQSLEPPTQAYILQALVLSGAELPTFGLLANPLRVRINMGLHEISTSAVKWENGICRWNEIIKSSKIMLPRDPAQIPDIFIYLIRDDGKPVCFKRLSPLVNKTQFIGFNQQADWVLLQEDKCIDALSKDVFPGNVLLKLGFGLASEAVAAEEEWRNDLEMSKQSKPYQVRVHLYQARNLPAADSNGLCDPYFKIGFQGQVQVSAKKVKTVFPVYYQTLIFDNMVIPDHQNFSFASQVCLRLYDSDLDGDDYLGTTFFNLKDAIVTPDPDEPLPDPVWRSFFFELPGDSQGDVLMQVQLIPTFGKAVPKIAQSIVPPSRSAFIEFVVIGIRDMAPFNFQNIQNPFLQIELNSFGTTFMSETKSSKKPEPMNPNFLERILMPVELPENSIFTTPLLIKAKDTRLGGWLKPIVGVCQIDLLHKLPWCEETYRPPRTDIFFREATVVQEGSGSSSLLPGGNSDDVAVKALELQSKRNQELEDDYVVSQEPISVDQYINERCANDDTGAGIFGALNHIKTSDFRDKGKRGGDMFADADMEDEADQPPAWMKNREKLDSELEVKLETTPFETYNLLRGQVNGFLGSTIKVVGRLKGLVRIVSSLKEAEEEPLLPEQLMNQLLKPKNYVVRLYALRAFQLAEMDYDIFGGKAKSDPYIRVKLGKKLFDDRKNAVDDVLEVDLYKMIPLETELPGIGRLNIEIMDKDLVGGDELIGATCIDLEDRWFDSRWQEYGHENMVLPGTGGDGTGLTVRWKTKPIERRSLYAPGMTQSQGIFECYLDIMTQEEASAFPPDDVALPPRQMFEVRVVIWKTKNVPPMDSLEGMSDLFVKCWPEGCDPQETDTHWRCKKGKASFNWRMLFDVELGHSTRAMKFPYLHIQLWDRDILKWNDCAGEGIVNLGRFYRKAYKRNMAIKLFEKKKGLAAKRAAKKKVLREDLIEDTADDIPPENDDHVEAKGAEGMADELDVITPLHPSRSEAQGGVERESQSAPSQPSGYVSPSSLLPPRDAVDSDDDDDDDEEPADKLDTGMGALPQHKVAESRMKKVDLKKDKKAKKKARASVAAVEQPAAKWNWAFWRKPAPKVDEEGKPLLAEDEEEGADKSEEEKKDDEDAEMKDMVTSFKNMTGLWDIDPDDSDWYHLEQKDKNDPTKVTPMGSICYSVQIWPKDKATVMAVGAARSEPNTNPFLPPPVGRLKFSWNPFVLGSELCGPALCAKLFCCLLCMTFIVLMIFCQPFLNIIINLIFVVY